MYSNIQYSETNVRISEYICIFALYKTQFLNEYEYEYIRSKFSNNRVWISINRIQIFKYSNISEYIRIFALPLTHCYWLYFLALNSWKSIYWSFISLWFQYKQAILEPLCWQETPGFVKLKIGCSGAIHYFICWKIACMNKPQPIDIVQQ